MSERCTYMFIHTRYVPCTYMYIHFKTCLCHVCTCLCFSTIVCTMSVNWRTIALYIHCTYMVQICMYTFMPGGQDSRCLVCTLKKTCGFLWVTGIHPGSDTVTVLRVKHWPGHHDNRDSVQLKTSSTLANMLQFPSSVTRQVESRSESIRFPTVTCHRQGLKLHWQCTHLEPWHLRRRSFIT